MLDAGIKLVGEDAQRLGADVGAELEVILGGLDVGLELGRDGPVHARAARDGDDGDRAVGELLFGRGALLGAAFQLDAVFILRLRAQLDAEDAGFGAVGDRSPPAASWFATCFSKWFPTRPRLRVATGIDFIRILFV